MESVIETIRVRKTYPPRHMQGAVMSHAVIENYPALDDINIYNAKNKDHFWLGVVTQHHATFHHGFDLEKYDSKEEWEDDVRKLVPDGLFDSEEVIHTTPHFFKSSMIDEDNYYFVVCKFEPSQKMMEFRQNLLRTFPHTNFFSSWEPHVSIASVADEVSRDKLMGRMKNVKVRLYDLYIGFNKK